MICSCIINVICAQDLIKQKDGTLIKSKVIKVGTTDVEYKKFSNLQGPLYSISISNIISITYEDGEEEAFDNQTKLSDPIQIVQPELQQDPIDYDSNPFADKVDPLYREAGQLYAAKAYKAAIKKMKFILNYSDTGIIRLYRGLCYYKLCKWSNAIKDFEIAYRSPELSVMQKEDVRNFMSCAEKAKFERSENGVQLLTAMGYIISNVILGATSPTNYTPSSGVGGNSSINRDASENNNESGGGYKPTKHECSTCHGKGKIIKYTGSYRDHNCDECGKYFTHDDHVHVVCPHCHGKRYTEY